VLGGVVVIELIFFDCGIVKFVETLSILAYFPYFEKIK
jgi:hypothetical protein